jgi:hypothetical protein
MSHAPSIDTIRARFAPPPKAGASVDELPTLDKCSVSPDEVAPALPKQLAKIFAERETAAEAAKTIFRTVGHPGQIVRVNFDHLSSGQKYRLNEPLAVLLDAPMGNKRWRGWLVSRDAAYASEWDLVLGPEEDPKDPMCQTVEIWNQVTLDLQFADKVLAELSAERLSAARVMAMDYSRKVLPVAINDHRMGVHLARELSDGTGVVTGTPLADSNDPRREYQALYADVGGCLSDTGVVMTPATAAATPARAETTGILAWLRLSSGHRPYQAAWGGALAFSVVVAVLLQITTTPDQTGEPPISERYIAGGEIQDIEADQPEERAKQVEQRLRQLGVAVELRYEAGGMVSMQADISSVPADQRAQLFRDFNIQPIAGPKLKLTFIQRPSGKDAK